MRIRNKLILAMAVPVAILIVQVALVNISIRELQSAVNFISSANSVIEDDFVALEQLDSLRTEIKQIPTRFINASESDPKIASIWLALSATIDKIEQSAAYSAVDAQISGSITDTRQAAEARIDKTQAVLSLGNSDLDTLLEVAIFSERDLVKLKDALNGLIVALRGQLQEAVAYEREIHNRPVIAGLVIGGLAVLVIIAFAWLYVDRRLVARLTALSESMLAISGGNLRADIPKAISGDEIGEMVDALTIFRATAVEVEEKNFRQIADARQRLIDAIETISEGFSLFDNDNRLVLSNKQYAELLFPGLEDLVQPGVGFEALQNAAVKAELVEDAKGREAEWIADRLGKNANPEGKFLQRRTDGVWIEVTEHKTAEGETVAIYADITKDKQSETVLLEAKNRAETANKLVTEKNVVLEGLSSKLSKYLSPQVYSSIFRGDQNVEIASKRKKLTVMFSDIAGFTEITDQLESEELTNLLNRYLNEMSRIALKHGATIDKYIGDAIMLFFGDPDSKGVREDALACVSMAMEMQDKMYELQREWLDQGLEKPFRLRVGINTGYCTVGNFGSQDRMDYTIIGSEVNLAERLESQAELDGILVSHQTYSLVKDGVSAEEQEPKSLKGFAKPVRTYKIVGLQTPQTQGEEIDKLALGGTVIDFNEAAMSPDERAKTANVLKEIIKRLET